MFTLDAILVLKQTRSNYFLTFSIFENLRNSLFMFQNDQKNVEILLFVFRLS